MLHSRTAETNDRSVETSFKYFTLNSPSESFSKVRTRATMSANCDNCITSWSLSEDGSHGSDCRAFLKVSLSTSGHL